jgi:hypothetical protein
VPRSFVVLALLASAGVLVAATVIGLVSLWPRDELEAAPSQFGRIETEQARVTGVEEVPCRGGTGQICARVSIELLSGPDEGDSARFTVGDLGRDLGLIAAVPVTTALAAVLATRLPPAALTDAHAGHAH